MIFLSEHVLFTDDSDVSQLHSNLTKLLKHAGTYTGTTGWRDEGRPMAVIYLDFSKSFNTLSHHIHTDKLRCVNQTSER